MSTLRFLTISRPAIQLEERLGRKKELLKKVEHSYTGSVLFPNTAVFIIHKGLGRFRSSAQPQQLYWAGLYIINVCTVQTIVKVLNCIKSPFQAEYPEFDCCAVFTQNSKTRRLRLKMQYTITTTIIITFLI